MPDVSKHRSCISIPLSFFPQKTDMITFIRLPELHLHLHVNWYITRIEKLVPFISKWYIDLHQTRSDFHGGDFQGMHGSASGSNMREMLLTVTRSHVLCKLLV